MLANALYQNLNTLEDKGIHSLVLTDHRHAVALQYIRGSWYLLDSERSTGPVRMTPETWSRVAEYSTAYRVARTSETQPTALNATHKIIAQATRVASTMATTRDAPTANHNEIPSPTVTQCQDTGPERPEPERTESEHERGTEDLETREREMEHEYSTKLTKRPNLPAVNLWGP